MLSNKKAKVLVILKSVTLLIWMQLYIMRAQTTHIIPIKGATSLLVGGIIPTENGNIITLTKNSKSQVAVSVTKEAIEVSSEISFPQKFYVLNAFSSDNIRLTLGEIYPKVNIKEVSFVSTLDKNASIQDYKLFTVENGFSEVFDATIINNNTIAIAGMGEIRAIATYGMVPASVMLPQAVLILMSPSLSFQKAYYITLPGENKYVWRLFRIEAISETDIVVAGEVYSEWDNEQNSPLNNMPFVARISIDGTVKWAYSIPQRGHINELVIGSDGTIWLFYTDLSMSGTYAVNLSPSTGQLINSFYIKDFVANNTIIYENHLVCAGKLNTGKTIEAGILIINPSSQNVYTTPVIRINAKLSDGAKVSPMDIKVFRNGESLGLAASLLGIVGDKSFIIITDIDFNSLKSISAVQKRNQINVTLQDEKNITLETTKIVDLKEFKGQVRNEKKNY